MRPGKPAAGSVDGIADCVRPFHRQRDEQHAGTATFQAEELLERSLVASRRPLITMPPDGASGRGIGVSRTLQLRVDHIFKLHFVGWPS